MIVPFALHLLLPLRRWYLQCKTARILAALDDRTLRDIGLDRAEIADVAQAAARAAGPAGRAPVIGHLSLARRRLANAA